MQGTTKQSASVGSRVFGAVAGGYGCLCIIVGLLALTFGLSAVTAENLGAVAGALVLIGVATPALLCALIAFASAVGLWLGKGWARFFVWALIALHVLIPLFLLGSGLL